MSHGRHGDSSTCVRDGAVSPGQVLCPPATPVGTFPALRLSFPICKMGRIILPYLTRSWLSGGALLHPKSHQQQALPGAQGTACRGDQGWALPWPPPDSIKSLMNSVRGGWNSAGWSDL